jgi:hypothetical protein
MFDIRTSGKIVFPLDAHQPLILFKGTLICLKQKTFILILFYNGTFLNGISVGIAKGYGLDGWGSIPGKGNIFLSPQRPDRLCETLKLCPSDLTFIKSVFK